MDEADAVDALTRLGLTTYEAKVFIALQRLGAATASEVNEVTDVPRSQVYGAADGLEEHGLVEVEQGSPKRYRPVELEEARRRLRSRIEREQDRAFAYLDDVQGEARHADEQQEEIWTLRGHETVTDRVASLIEDADEYVVYAVGEELLDERLADALTAAAARGCAVTVVSEDDAVVEWAADLDGVVASPFPEEKMRTPDEEAGRICIVDGDAVLLSVVNDEFGTRQETAILSSGTGFAQVFVSLLERRLGGHAEF